MGQRSVRFPDELVARAEAWATEQDRSFSYVAVKALEVFLARKMPSPAAEVLTGTSDVVGDPPQRREDVDNAQSIRKPSSRAAGELPKIAPRHWS